MVLVGRDPAICRVHLPGRELLGSLPVPAVYRLFVAAECDGLGDLPGVSVQSGV